jgi:hypothetical protein
MSTRVWGAFPVRQFSPQSFVIAQSDRMTPVKR